MDITVGKAVLGHLKIVYRNPSPKLPRVEYETRTVVEHDLTDALARYEEDGWTVHTVERRYNAIQGESYWVLLRRENEPKRNVYA